MEYDDFEIIDPSGLSNEQTFEIIDTNDNAKRSLPTSEPTSPEKASFIPMYEHVIHENDQPTKELMTIETNGPSVLIGSASPPQSTTPMIALVPAKYVIASPEPSAKSIPRVPSLPKAPPLRRFGEAASIPHNLDETLNMDAIINESRKSQEAALNASLYDKQKYDVQTVIEQRLASGSAFSNVLKAKEDLQKSPEQLANEKRSILAERIPQLNLDGKTKAELIEKIKQFHEVLQSLHGAIYELTERFERQKYDMVELTERARQIEKGKAKTRKSNIVHTGLGGGLFSGVNDVTSNSPAKVSLFSRYERVTDRRTFKDRRDVWAIEKRQKEFVAERPLAKIKQVAPISEDASARKAKRVPIRQKTEEKRDEELPPPPPVEKQEEEEQAPPDEEEPAPEEEEEEKAEEPAEEQNEEPAPPEEEQADEE